MRTTTHLSTPPPGRVKPDQYGRIKETWPEMPEPEPALVAEIETWLRGHRNSIRTLPVCAPLMTIVCALHEAGPNHHLPTRERLAEAVEKHRRAIDPSRARAVRAGEIAPTSVHSIDAALSTAAGLGDTEEEVRTEEGGVSQRPSIRRRRFVTPSKQLLHVYRIARRRVSKVAADTA